MQHQNPAVGMMGTISFTIMAKTKAPNAINKSIALDFLMRNFFLRVCHS